MAGACGARSGGLWLGGKEEQPGAQGADGGGILRGQRLGGETCGRDGQEELLGPEGADGKSTVLGTK